MNSIDFLYFADIFFDFFHIALMLFIVFAWLVPGLRKSHLIVVLITGSSWLIFSNGNGFSDCILTNWHYQILRKLGETNLPETYAQYTVKRLTGISIPKNTAFTITRIGLLLSLCLSSYLILKEYRPKRKINIRK